MKSSTVFAAAFVALVLGAGTAGVRGQLLNNGSSGTTTVAVFPHKPSAQPKGISPSIKPVRPNFVSIRLLSDQTIQLNCGSIVPGTFLIQATTNLYDPLSWVTISTNIVDTNGLFQCIDTDAPNYPCRFYRIATQ